MSQVDEDQPNADQVQDMWPWRRLQVMTSVEDKNKMANHTRDSCWTWKSQAWIIRTKKRLCADWSTPCWFESNARECPPPNIIKRLDFKHLLKRLGFSLEMAQTVVCNHGYDTAKKLSCLKLMILTSLSKPYAPQAESVMTEKKTGISVPHHMHWHLHIILFHWVCSDFCPMIYTITNLVGNYDVMMTP